MDRESDDRPVFVAMPDGQSDDDGPRVARPGVVVWLGEKVPDQDEVDRAAAMRRHPANTESSRHLRAVG